MPVLDLDITQGIHCWNISESEDELIKLVDLSEVERSLIFAHKREQRRKELLGTRALLATVIPNEHIHYIEKRPVLVNSDKEISISNSKKLVVIQIKNKDVFTGVDIQYFSDTVVRVKHKYLHPTEFNLFNSSNEVEILNIIWSAKESLYKAYSEEKLEFKKQLIVQEIDYGQKNITGIITREEGDEKFTLGMYTNNDFVLTWFKS